MNKWLAQSGVCSRREADELIAAGAVMIDGERVSDAGRKISAGQTLVLNDRAELGLGVFPYSPNARGILSGKYTPGAAPPDGSRASLGDDSLNKRMRQSEFRPENITAAQAIAAHAKQRGLDPTAFAVAWVLANPTVTGAIAGPRTMAQWESYLAAFHVEWTAADEAAVDALVPPGTTAVPQFIDPAYPIEGRGDVRFGRL